MEIRKQLTGTGSPLLAIWIVERNLGHQAQHQRGLLRSPAAEADSQIIALGHVAIPRLGHRLYPCWEGHVTCGLCRVFKRCSPKWYKWRELQSQNLLQVWGQPTLHSEFQHSKSYIKRPCVKKYYMNKVSNDNIHCSLRPLYSGCPTLEPIRILFSLQLLNHELFFYLYGHETRPHISTLPVSQNKP